VLSVSSMSMEILITERAKREIRSTSQWWREHGAGPAFHTELERVLATLQEMPHLGQPCARCPPGTRRVLLSRTKNHLYYRIEGNCIEVLSVWHTSRGQGPAL